MDSNQTEDNKLDVAKKQAEEDIFAAMGAADIPDAEKGELLVRMMDLVQSRALLKIVDKLNDDEKKELETMLDDENLEPEKLEKFIVDKVPDYEQLFVDESKRLRQELTIEFAQ